MQFLSGSPAHSLKSVNADWEGGFRAKCRCGKLFIGNSPMEAKLAQEEHSLRWTKRNRFGY